MQWLHALKIQLIIVYFYTVSSDSTVVNTALITKLVLATANVKTFTLDRHSVAIIKGPLEAI
jgi:hypothetical protein